MEKLWERTPTASAWTIVAIGSDRGRFSLATYRMMLASGAMTWAASTSKLISLAQPLYNPISGLYGPIGTTWNEGGGASPNKLSKNSSWPAM